MAELVYLSFNVLVQFDNDYFILFILLLLGGWVNGC